MSLYLNSSPYIAAGAALIALAAAYYYYRRTVPPIRPGMRYLLGALRWLGLVLLLLFLFEPAIHRTFSTSVPPAVAVLFDNSQSMGIHDGGAGDTSKGGGRISEEMAVEQATLKSRLAGNVRTFTFGDSVKTVSLDSLKLTAADPVTNISSALAAIAKKRAENNIQAVVLVTDGQYTVGEDPMTGEENLPVPIYTIGVGDSAEQKDILVSAVVANEVALKGTAIPIQATIHSVGFDNRLVTVTLTDDNRPVATQQITLHAGIPDYSVSFSATPQTPGTHKLAVSVTALAGELTAKNNVKTFFVKIIDTKINLALFAGAPSADVSFLRQAFAANTNFNVTPFIQKQGGDFSVNPLTSPDFTNADCIVLIGFPVADTRVEILRAIAERAAQKNVPLFFLWGENIDAGRLQELQQFLPFTTAQTRGQSRAGAQLTGVSVTRDALLDPVMRLSGAAGDSAQWNTLPPAYYDESLFRAKPEASVLATMRLFNTTTREPVILSERLNAMKTVAVLASGIWRWRLLGKGSADAIADNAESQAAPATDVYMKFISNAVEWLTAKSDEKQTHIRPVKEIFSPQEESAFTGQVLDEKYSPIENAAVTVAVTNGAQKYSITLAPMGGGQYSGALSALPEGDYSYEGTAQQGDKTIGKESGKFSVAEAGIEFQNTRMNAPELQSIAVRSGGIFTTPEHAQAVFDSIAAIKSFAPLTVVHTSEIELWTNVWMLTCALVCFCVEWFMRKRAGLL